VRRVGPRWPLRDVECMAPFDNNVLIRLPIEC
jgi:hypothetical protein